MAIDGGLRKQLKPGAELIGRYRGAEHRAQLVEGADGRVRYRLADGREFTSPSAAGSAVMGGVACNGWRFWSLVDGAGAAARPAGESKPAAARAAAKKRPARGSGASRPPASRESR